MTEPWLRPAEPTTVVGYPDLASGRGPTPGSKALEKLPGQVRTLRMLVVACLALLVVLTVGLGVALAGALSQVGELSDRVAALDARLAAPAAESAQAPAQQQPAEETQLGAVADLDPVDGVPAGVDSAGAVLIGDANASNVVEVYIDYQCPFCQKWDAEIGAALHEKALEPGSDLLVKQYNLAFLGEQNAQLTPAGASARAANAAACVLHADGAEVFVAFSQSVFAAADPTEPPTQFTAEQLAPLAEEAGASPEAVACIGDEAYVPFVAATTRAGFTRGVSGTPTVVVNGTTLANPFTDPALTQLVGAG